LDTEKDQPKLNLVNLTERDFLSKVNEIQVEKEVSIWEQKNHLFSKRRYQKRMGWTVCVFGVLLLITSAFTFLFSVFEEPVSELELNVLTQLRHDWTQNMWIDVQVQEKPCVAPYEDMFTRRWQGLGQHCIVKGQVLTEECKEF
jgi:hypothetical protein